MTLVRCTVAALIAIASAGDVSAQAPASKPPPLSNGAVAGQISTGMLGTAVGFIGGGITTRWAANKLGVSETGAVRAGYAGALVGGVLVTAVGPSLIGSRGDVSGSYGSAVGGAAAGGVVALGVKQLGRRGVFGDSGPGAWLAAIVVAALPSVGATIAYNASR